LATLALCHLAGPTIESMSESGPPGDDRRWPRSVYGVGREPDPRFTLANERTFLAWVRTSLGFLAAGVAVATIARFSAGMGIEVRLTALLLIICGLVCAAGGFRRWMRQERAIRLEAPLPSTPAIPFIAAVLVLVAVTGLILITLR
jgi:putative membrane protein